MKVSSWSRVFLISSSRPSSASPSSWLIVCSWASPPPLSTRDSAPSSSSTSTLRLVRSSGISEPSSSVPSRLLVARRGQLDELLAQQRGLLDGGHRVGRQVDVAVDRDGDERGPVVGQLDLLDPAHRDVGDPDAGLRHQVQDVEELDLHRVRVVAEVGAAGQVEGVRAAEAAAAEQQDAGAPARRCAAAAGSRGPRSTGGQADRARPPRRTAGPPPPPRSACRSSSRSGVPLPLRSSSSPSAFGVAGQQPGADLLGRGGSVSSCERSVMSSTGRSACQPAELGRATPQTTISALLATRGRCRGCRACRSRGCRRGTGCPAPPARRRAPRPAPRAAGPGRG